jgi:acetylxylan esterase
MIQQMGRLPRRCFWGAVVLCGGLLTAMPARAASMVKVNQSDWQAGVTGLPSYVNMYIYVPDKPATKPPVVVAPHHCQGTASSTYSEMKSLETIADSNGFIMIFPEATGENCWDAGSSRSLKHGGGGDTGAIVQMVKYVMSKYGADANRVYTVGGSSGGIMTEALLGVYPDVFMAGVSLMGVPCGCWASGYNDVTGTGSTAQWSGNCAGGSVTMTGAAWGSLVKSYFPGYTGHRPRLQHWHGTADTTLNYKNMAEDIKEWANLLGLSETPTGTDTPASGTTHQFWKNSCGYVVYETFALAGVGHAVPFDGNEVAAYFGLDKSGGQDPETAACPGAVPGGAAGGASGAAGTSGAGGSSSGAAGASGGRAGANGGAGGKAGAAGGAAGATGGAGTGAAGHGSGGAIGSGGATGSGGSGTGGNGTGGSGTGGAGTGGDAQGTGGSPGATGQGGSPADGGSSVSGCSCVVASGGAGSLPAVVAVALVGSGLLRRRRKRGRR